MKRAKSPTKREQAWQDWLRAQGCAVCGDAAMIHHCIGTGSQASQGGIYIGQVFTLPLCHEHHQGDMSIHNRPLTMAQYWGLPGETRKEIERTLFDRMLAHYQRHHDAWPVDADTIQAVYRWRR